MSKKTSIWIDLEETVINSWYNPILIPKNIEKIKRYCVFHGFDSNRINIFSHAIWNDEDFDVFYDHGIATDLEQAFGSPYVINKCMKVDWLISQTVKNISSGEYVSRYNKFESFMKYVPLIGAFDTKFILFDDVVPNYEIEMLDFHNSVKFVNINSI